MCTCVCVCVCLCGFLAGVLSVWLPPSRARLWRKGCAAPVSLSDPALGPCFKGRPSRFTLIDGYLSPVAGLIGRCISGAGSDARPRRFFTSRFFSFCSLQSSCLLCFPRFVEVYFSLIVVFIFSLIFFVVYFVSFLVIVFSQPFSFFPVYFQWPSIED